MQSLVISHVANETASFTPAWVITETDFNTYLNLFMPEPQLAPVKAAIKVQYPAQGYPYYGDQRGRIADVIRDSSFTCNTRWLYDGYRQVGAGTYMMQYGFLDYILGYHENKAVHASDLLPLFWNSDVNMTFYLETCLQLPDFIVSDVAKKWDKYAGYFQAYFVEHALTGSPNPSTDWLTWYNATNDKGYLTYVMETSTGTVLFPDTYFNPFSTDYINEAARCWFWENMAAKITPPPPGEANTGGGLLQYGHGGQETLAWEEEL